MINLAVSNYTGIYASLNGNKRQRLRPIDVARAFATVGRASWGDTFNTGLFRIGELLCKALAFCELSNTDLILCNRFHTLNQSEKAPVSYYFGQSLTKLYAERYIHIKWLLHVDDYKKEVILHENGKYTPKIIVATSNKNPDRPDLFGLERKNEAHIFEAKGRSTGYDLSEMQHAINQVSRVESYNGNPIKTSAACYFDLSQQPIQGHIIDPPNDAGNIQLIVDEEAVLEEYYSFFRKNSQLFNPELINDRVFLTTPIGIPSLRFGFDERILNLSNNSLLVEDLYTQNEFATLNDILDVSLGLDGIILRGKLNKNL